MPHINELYDYGVGIYIVYDQAVLFVKHPRYDKWLAPGGHIELDENPEQALFREISEETGLEVAILSDRLPFDEAGNTPILQPRYIDVHEANPPHQHIVFIYFALAKNSDFKLSAEHTDYAWLNKEDLHNSRYGLAGSIIFYAEKALEAAAINSKT
jgi:8-oxo-dGTP pyrophosphatase MutT (NUDIX family)